MLSSIRRKNRINSQSAFFYPVCSLQFAFCAQSAFCTRSAVSSLHFVLTGLVLLFLFEIKINEVARDYFYKSNISLTRSKKRKSSHNHLNNSVTKHLSTVTFLTYFVDAWLICGENMALRTQPTVLPPS